MIKVKYILFAKSVVIDQRSLQVTANNIIEEISAPKFPSIIPESNLIICFTRNIEDDAQIKLKLKAFINDKVIGFQDIDVDFKNVKINRTVVDFQTFPITETGTLKFELRNNKNKKIASYQVDVVVMPANNLISK